MRLRGCGVLIWRFMVIFSFIVNFVLVLVLIGLGLFIFDIKENIAAPLIGGLHSTATGLDEATIDWTIPVRVSDLPINIDVPINETTIISEVNEIGNQPVAPIAGETLVVLTRDVPLQINNAFIQSNDLTLRNATVNITLPAGTELPVALNLAINLDTTIPVNLDVRAVIPLRETQLHDPIETLGLLFEPLAIGLHNLPSGFNEVPDFVGQVLDPNRPAEDLLLATDGSGFNPEPYDPWPGYTRTAGTNYPWFGELFPPDNVSYPTGIVVPGGIPALDSALPRRSPYYEDGSTPAEHNADVIEDLEARDDLPDYTWDGSVAETYNDIQEAAQEEAAADGVPASNPNPEEAPLDSAPNVGGSDAILPTPTSP